MTTHLIGEESKPLTFLGATAVQPIIDMVRLEYQKKYHTNLLTEGGGSDKGIRYLSEDKADIAMVYRSLLEEEKRLYAYAIIGYDAVAIIVHKDNPITAISKQQLIDVYRGKITNWNQLGGVNKALIPISKEPNRGTIYQFEKETGLFHSSRRTNTDPAKKITPLAWEAGANNDNIVWVGGLLDAISYVSLGNAKSSIAKGMPIKIIPLEGVFPSKQSIANHTYPIIGELVLVYNKNNIKAKNFIDYILSDEGQHAVEKNKFTRVNHGK